MPALWAALSGLIGTRGGAWVASILASLGIGLAVQGAVFGPLLDYASSSFNGLPSSVAAWVGFFVVDIYVTIVISAYAGAGVKRVFMRRLAA